MRDSTPMGRGPRNYEEKLITPEQAVELMEGGWRRADLHVHTTCSFDVLPVRDLHPESLYEKALKIGNGLRDIYRPRYHRGIRNSRVEP